MEQVLRDETSARAFVEGLTDAAGMLCLEALSAALINENQRQNLISRPSEAQMWVRHIADSAQLLRFVPRETPSSSVSSRLWRRCRPYHSAQSCVPRETSWRARNSEGLSKHQRFPQNTCGQVADKWPDNAQHEDPVTLRRCRDDSRCENAPSRC